LSTDDQAALAGEAASKAAKASGLSAEEQDVAADMARTKILTGGVSGDVTVRSREVDDGAQDIQSENTVDATKGDGAEKESQAVPWWIILLVVLALLACAGLGYFFYQRATASKQHDQKVVSRKASFNHRERVDDADVELQAPLVGGGFPTREIGEQLEAERHTAVADVGPPGVATAPDATTALFNSLDKDGDGVISQSEWQQGMSSRTPQFPTAGTRTGAVTSYPGPAYQVSSGASRAVPMIQVAQNPMFAARQPIVVRTVAAPTYVVGAPAVQAGPQNQAATNLFNRIDLDHDGKISPQEWQVHQNFTAFDRNHDGFISPAEWQQGARSSVPNRELMEPVSR
jgi:hypothetical protein